MRNVFPVFWHCLNWRRILSGKHRRCSVTDNWRHETVYFCECGYLKPDPWDDLIRRQR